MNLEGLGDSSVQKLRRLGIATLHDLLERGATPRGRRGIAGMTGISEHRILRWVNRADLFRIQVLDERDMYLLAAAGVETVVELAQRRPGPLHQKLVEINEVKRVVRVVPGADHVADWVEQARALPRVVSY
jgi:hypothetical protein